MTTSRLQSAKARLIANLCTYPPRFDSFQTVVSEIAPQVDVLNVVLNEYDSVPKFLSKYSNIQSTIPEENTRDIGKFLPAIPDDAFVFLIDDDIAYPADYVVSTLERYNELADQSCIVGYHGSIYERPKFKLRRREIKRYLSYKPELAASFRKVYYFKRGNTGFFTVDQLGTGLTLVPPGCFPSYDYMKTAQRFADVRFARFCFEQQISMVMLPCDTGWLTERQQQESIYHEFTLHNPKEVANEILTFAYQRKTVGQEVLLK